MRLAALASLVLACVPAPPATCLQAEADRVSSATWSDAAPLVAWHPGPFQCAWIAPGSEARGWTERGGCYLGITRQDGGDIQISPRESSAELSETLAHELAHARLWWESRDASHGPAHDRETARARLHVDPEALRYCADLVPADPRDRDFPAVFAENRH